MLVFTTKLPLKDEISKEDCLQMFIDWIVGSHYYPITRDEINYDSNKDDEFLFEKSGTRVAIRHYKDDVKVLACRLEYDDRNTIWAVDNIFINKKEERYLVVQLNRSTKLNTYITPPKTPMTVRLCIKNGFCNSDGGIPVIGEPLDADCTFYKECVDIMTGVHKYSMPAVYISSDYQGNNIVDAEKLAKRLEGIAHVFVEKNHETAYKLRQDTQENNVHNGYVGIYFPKTKYCQRYSLLKYEENVKIEKIANAVICALLNQTNDSIYNWYQIGVLQFKQKMVKMKKISTQEEQDFKEFIDAYEEENKLLKDKNQELEKKIEDLKQKNNSLKDEREYLIQENNRKECFYQKGKEVELYAGEKNDLLNSILTQVKDKYITDSRSAVLIQSLIEANPPIGGCEEKIKVLREVIKPGVILGEREKRKLKEIGFRITDDGSHYKLRFYGDSRYQFIAPKTPSDNRGAKNLFSEICKKIDINRKIN